jgi:ribonuclease HI
MDSVLIYTDGGCDNNGTKIGGWGVYLMYLEHRKKLNGGQKDTTSNRMELTAAIKALKALKHNKLKVKLHSDSQYLIKGMNEWHKAWLKNNWKSSTGKDVVNRDLWEALVALNKKFDIEWIWVRGHNGDICQEQAHTLADEAMRKLRKY